MEIQERGEMQQEQEEPLVHNVRLPALRQESSIVNEQDDFKKGIDDLLNLSGLSQNFKRTTKRRLEKALVTVGGQVVEADNNQYSGDEATSKQIIPDKYGYGIFDVVEPQYNQYALAKIYELSAPNYAAINAKVANIVGLGYDLLPSSIIMQRMEDAETSEELARIRKNVSRAKSRVIDWLETRNDDDTFTATLMKVYIDVESTGNGYIEIGRKSNGEIGYIGHIPAPTMRVRRIRDGYVQIVSGKAVYFRNFQDTTTRNPITTDARPNEIIHIKEYTPTNTYYGVPAIVAAKNAMAGNEFASRFNIEYFENKAVPRYVFWLKGAKMSREAEERLFEFFQGNLRGQNHRTVIIPIPADTPDGKVEMKMEAVENTIQDSSFNNYRKGNVSEILMVHRTPASKVGAAEGIGLAAAREADRTFKEQVCRPAQDSLEKKINKIIQEKTDIFRFEFNELTLTDEETQSKIDERYLRMRVVVPNEVRERLNLSSLPEGDAPVILSPQQAAEQTAQATGNRLRDQQREANASDSNGTGRATMGDGRQQN
ncbi:MAG: phage portal protein [Alphaproteobacteria bacterium]|nr:phage portal protein [Alphaproteobacteria bacterium]